MEPLVVQATDLYPKPNAEAHHTDMYDLVNMDPPTPVLRRGNDFYLAVSFDREFDPTLDVIRICFEFGK